jgi:hypothetical protein
LSDTSAFSCVFSDSTAVTDLPRSTRPGELEPLRGANFWSKWDGYLTTRRRLGQESSACGRDHTYPLRGILNLLRHGWGL